MWTCYFFSELFGTLPPGSHFYFRWVLDPTFHHGLCFFASVAAFLYHGLCFFASVAAFRFTIIPPTSVSIACQRTVRCGGAGGNGNNDGVVAAEATYHRQRMHGLVKGGVRESATSETMVEQ